MADNKEDIEKVPKKRGRKPKQDVTVNEEKENITMSTKKQSNITMQNIQSRMAQIFNQNKNLGINDYILAMGKINQNNNPYIQNERIKRINASPRSSTKQDTAKALENPGSNEELFKSESWALYYQNYVYNNLLKLNRDVPMYYNYVLPKNVSLSDCKKKDFKKEMKFVEDFVDKLNIRKAGKDISLSVAIEGKRSYVFRTGFNKDKTKVNYAVLQKLPSEWVKYTAIGSSTDYVTSFDFMMFLQAGESVDRYPLFFRDIWDAILENKIVELDENGKYTFKPQNADNLNGRYGYELEYKNDRYMYWVELPQVEVVEFGSDDTSPLQVPDYIGLFTDLRGLDDYKWLQNQLLSKAVNSVLVGTVPMVDKLENAGADETAISMDSIIGFSDMFSNAVSNNVIPFFAPFEDYKLLSLPLPPDAKEIVNTSLKNLINSSGMGALISTTDKPSIISVKTAQQLAESKAEYVMIQVQKAINNYINKKLDLKYEFYVTIWGGRFTYLDELKFDKELLISGVTSMLPRILSATNQSLSDFDSTTNYIDSLGLYNGKIRPFSTVNREENDSEFDDGSEKKVGRPSVGNDIENDNTANSLDLGTNVSDIKDFSVSNHSCLICGEDVDGEDMKICDKCLDEMYHNRIDEIINQ